MRLMLRFLVIVALLSGATSAADRPDRQASDTSAERDLNLFHFVRIRYHGYGGFGFWGGGWVEPWAHDYPRAEQNLLRILGELTLIPTRSDAYLILDLEDPRIMDYPMLYVSEPGYWDCTAQEVENLREYLLRGGFVLFDDFRDFRGEWEAFASCMQRVFPTRPLERLTEGHPIFHCFYDIERLDMTPPYSVPGPPAFFGINDDTGRLQVVAAFNNDLGDYWEWSDQRIVPIQLSNEAYKFAVNFIVYALSH
jgi:hypothetical protein